VTVPSVVGQYLPAARRALVAAGVRTQNLNTPCNAGGNPQKASVVVSLVLVGTIETLTGGEQIPKSSSVGVTWSGCYGKGIVVPNVVGDTWPVGVAAIQSASLVVGCTSSQPYGPGNTTPNVGTISAQSVAAGTNVPPKTKVYLTQQLCQKDLPPSGNTGGSGNTGNT
jgi:beta-lactam-binding protein with PASTA domain